MRIILKRKKKQKNLYCRCFKLKILKTPKVCSIVLFINARIHYVWKTPKKHVWWTLIIQLNSLWNLFTVAASLTKLIADVSLTITLIFHILTHSVSVTRGFYELCLVICLEWCAVQHEKHIRGGMGKPLRSLLATCRVFLNWLIIARLRPTATNTCDHDSTAGRDYRKHAKPIHHGL